MDTNNISSTFTDKSDAILAEIMKKNNLEGGINNLDDIFINLVLTKFTMYFSRKEISEKEFVASIQKEINIPQQTAEQIVKEIINNLIPTLGKYSEEKNPADNAGQIKRGVGEEKDLDLFPKIKPPSGTDKNKPDFEVPIPKKEPGGRTTQNSEKIKKPEENKYSSPKPRQKTGPDNYREPIE
ncbi:MAG: hypothetical protein ABSF55_00555 [Candidatus Staskawiczbacteria bacterium]|jgi:hypothetical protein